MPSSSTPAHMQKLLISSPITDKVTKYSELAVTGTFRLYGTGIEPVSQP